MDSIVWHVNLFGSQRIKQRLALYQGVMPIQMEFTDDAEETFAGAVKLLMVWFISW